MAVWAKGVMWWVWVGLISGVAGCSGRSDLLEFDNWRELDVSGLDFTHFSEVQILSKNDVWVGGRYHVESYTQGVIAHCNGSAWDVFINELPYEVTAIYFLSSNEGWVGSLGLWHYANGNLEKSPDIPSGYVTSIRFTPNGCGWIIITGGGLYSYIFCCTDSSWALVDSFSFRIADLEFRNDNDGWAVGEYGIVLHYDGTSWSIWDSTGPWDIPRNIEVDSFGGVWVGYYAGEDYYYCALARWNGTSWEWYNIGGRELEFTNQEGWLLEGFWGENIWRYRGGFWERISPEGESLGFLEGLDFNGPDYGWAVGERIFIYER